MIEENTKPSINVNIYMGIVIDNNDPDNSGRIKQWIPQLQNQDDVQSPEQKDSLPWIYPLLFGSHSPQEQKDSLNIDNINYYFRGIHFTPRKGDIVYILTFTDDLKQQYYLPLTIPWKNIQQKQKWIELPEWDKIQNKNYQGVVQLQQHDHGFYIYDSTNPDIKTQGFTMRTKQGNLMDLMDKDKNNEEHVFNLKVGQTIVQGRGNDEDQMFQIKTPNSKFILGKTKGMGCEKEETITQGIRKVTTKNSIELLSKKDVNVYQENKIRMTSQNDTYVLQNSNISQMQAKNVNFIQGSNIQNSQGSTFSIKQPNTQISGQNFTVLNLSTSIISGLGILLIGGFQGLQLGFPMGFQVPVSPHPQPEPVIYNQEDNTSQQCGKDQDIVFKDEWTIDIGGQKTQGTSSPQPQTPPTPDTQPSVSVPQPQGVVPVPFWQGSTKLVPWQWTGTEMKFQSHGNTVMTTQGNTYNTVGNKYIENSKQHMIQTNAFCVQQLSCQEIKQGGFLKLKGQTTVINTDQPNVLLGQQRKQDLLDLLQYCNTIQSTLNQLIQAFQQHIHQIPFGQTSPPAPSFQSTISLKKDVPSSSTVFIG